MRQSRTPLVVVMVVLALAGCGPLSNTKDTVNTVDKAVALLQTIDQYGSWTTLEDGFDALGNLNDGYTAEIRWSRDSAPAGSSASDVIIRVQTNSTDGSVFQVTDGDSTQTYFVPVPENADLMPPVYQLQDDQYVCLGSDAPAYALLQGGIPGIFAYYDLPSMLKQTLSAVKKQGDSVVGDRKATRYTIVSQIPEALSILDQFEDQTLRARVEAAQTLSLTGSLNVDKDTAALLSFEVVYAENGQKTQTTFSFAVLQWGNTGSGLPYPAPSQLETVCN